MEIEAKYRVTPADLDQIAALRELGSYKLRTAPGVEQQQNDYYDTPDRRLGQARYGLRLRRIGSRSIVTLKGPAHVGDDGIHRRAEYEFDHHSPDPRGWPTGPAQALALALIGAEPLAPLLRIVTTRRKRYAVYAGRAVAELALDQGEIEAGPRRAAICELEIELLPDGSVDDIGALAAALRGLIHLAPEPKTKLERGMALLNS